MDEVLVVVQSCSNGRAHCPLAFAGGGESSQGGRGKEEARSFSEEEGIIGAAEGRKGSSSEVRGTEQASTLPPCAV
jgi:hypothetical protein